MGDSLQKALLTVSTLSLCVIAVQLIPISRVANYKLICAEAVIDRGDKNWDWKVSEKLGGNSSGSASLFCSRLHN